MGEDISLRLHGERDRENNFFIFVYYFRFTIFIFIFRFSYVRFTFFISVYFFSLFPFSNILFFFPTKRELEENRKREEKYKEIGYESKRQNYTQSPPTNLKPKTPWVNGTDILQTLRDSVVACSGAEAEATYVWIPRRRKQTAGHTKGTAGPTTPRTRGDAEDITNRTR